MSDRLIEEDREAALAPLMESGWQMVEGRDAITKPFFFRNFVEAFGFMTRAALWAEKWKEGTLKCCIN